MTANKSTETCYHLVDKIFASERDEVYRTLKEKTDQSIQHMKILQLEKSGDKELWVVVGPQGSGKSSLMTQLMQHPNFPSYMFNEEYLSMEPHEMSKNMHPHEFVQKLQKMVLKAGVSMAVEAEESPADTLLLMNKAKELGYSIKVFFVALDSPRQTLGRAGTRVPEEYAFEEYQQMMFFCPAFWETADVMEIYDNTGEFFVLSCLKVHEQCFSVNSEIRSSWVDHHVIKSLSSKFPEMALVGTPSPSNLEFE